MFIKVITDNSLVPPPVLPEIIETGMNVFKIYSQIIKNHKKMKYQLYKNTSN